MATNPAGKGKVHISTGILKEVSDLIEKRAEKMGWKKGKYAATILENWFNEGAHPINSIEEAIIEKEKFDPSKELAKLFHYLSEEEKNFFLEHDSEKIRNAANKIALLPAAEDKKDYKPAVRNGMKTGTKLLTKADKEKEKRRIEREKSKGN